jgi:hypothetical protein
MLQTKRHLKIVVYGCTCFLDISEGYIFFPPRAFEMFKSMYNHKQ